MDRVFLALLAAHLVADFALRPERWVKTAWLGLLLRLAAGLGLSVLFLGAAPWPVLAILAALGLLLGLLLEARGQPEDLRLFTLVQALRLATFAAVATAFPDVWRTGLWDSLAPDLQTTGLIGLTLISGLTVNLLVGAEVIRRAVAPFVAQIRSNIRGLNQGGAYIGWLERGLVMLLILMNQPAGVGFLITAKSILRFGDIKDSKSRKATEYIIIGTFMSFGWGLLASALTQLAIKHWLA